MDAGRKRNDIMQEFLAKYNRGQISKEQYLNQKKAMLLDEQAEKQEAHDQAQACLDCIAEQLAEIEEELAEITETTA